jgi:thiamine-phosphate pyrophosphorylase
MTLCLVTDRRQLSPDARTPRDEVLALTRWLEEAVPAGLDLIQIRERDLPGRLIGEIARAVTGLTAGSRTRVVVNDRADVAVAAGCDGVHLRGDGPPVGRVRGLFRASAPSTQHRAPGTQHRAPSALLIGRSVHSGAEARVHVGADYLMFGAVFPSGPKPGQGLAVLREVAATTAAPVLAIGGMTVARAAGCLAAGAAGVAAIGLFLPHGRASGALGIAAATAALRALDAGDNRVS